MRKILFILFLILVVIFTQSCSGQIIDVSASMPTLTSDSPFNDMENVFTADDLKAKAADENCNAICITNEISLFEKIIFNRPVDITVKAPLKFLGGFILITCENEGTVNITEDGGSIDEGSILLDAPNIDLYWSGGFVPDISFISANMNVKTFNQNEVNTKPFGGALMPEITDISLTSKDGIPLSDLTFKTAVNSVTLELPFDVKEKEIKNAVLGITAQDAELYSVTDFENNPVNEFSLRENYLITLKQGEANRTYSFHIKRQSKNLPVISLYTDNGEKIASKETYVGGSLSIDCSGAKEYFGFNLDEQRLSVKGRGNASWNYTDKKAYRLKFDEKVGILGLNPDKDWVLVSNYFDKSLVRNALAHKMADCLENLYYNPTHIMVDLFINGEYRGVYSIADKIETSKQKIDLGNPESDDLGFLIEIGWNFNEVNVYGKDYFDTNTIVRLFVKEPEITSAYNSQMKYIMDYVKKADAAIVKGEGYEEYLDINALVDWFILAELTNNTEMAFYRSCYMYKPEGGKLILGPVWDFDMAFGNHRGDIKGYDGWATAEATYSYVNDTWTTYLIKDDDFMKLVKERWNEKRDLLLNTANTVLNELYEKVSPSADENFKLWDIMDEQIGEGNVDYRKYNTYELQIEYIREFITARANWIDAKLGV